ncbi:MAG: transposase [Victivallaceae bacterium]|nr:transposase [Victivallaceae bacterium]
MTEEQFETIYHLIKRYEPKRRKFGRPRRDDREILRGVLWILRSGARWKDLPKGDYPPYQICHRRFQEWVDAGTFQSVLTRLAKDFKDFELSECFIDGTFASAKKGATQSAKPNGAKVQKLWSSEMLMVFLSPHM